MNENYCKNCIYLIKEKVKSITNVEKTPLNMRSKPMIDFINENNNSKNLAEKEVYCCIHSDNVVINYLQGKVYPVPCEKLNKYGECKKFDSGLTDPDSEGTA